LPQLPVCEPAPLVVPLKVPPWAGMMAGLSQPPGRVVVVVGVVVDVVVVGGSRVVVVVEVVVVEVVVAGQTGVLTLTLPLFDDWFPAKSTAETA